MGKKKKSNQILQITLEKEFPHYFGQNGFTSTNGPLYTIFNHSRQQNQMFEKKLTYKISQRYRLLEKGKNVQNKHKSFLACIKCALPCV